MGVTGILVGRDILRGSSINDVTIFKGWGEGIKSKSDDHKYIGCAIKGGSKISDDVIYGWYLMPLT